MYVCSFDEYFINQQYFAGFFQDLKKINVSFPSVKLQMSFQSDYKMMSISMVFGLDFIIHIFNAIDV